MMWQDYIFTIGSFVFIIALIPSILSKDKPAIASSISTALVLTIFSFTYFSLSLWLTTITTAGTAMAWHILAFQKYRIDIKNKH